MKNNLKKLVLILAVAATSFAFQATFQAARDPEVARWEKEARNVTGVYQVNVQVPAGVTLGDALPVVLTQGGFRSNTATIAVR